VNRRLADRPESKIDDTVNMGMQVLKEYTADDDRLMTLSVGPQHPGSGHFRFTRRRKDVRVQKFHPKHSSLGASCHS
jgi:hypothetical protein